MCYRQFVKTWFTKCQISTFTGCLITLFTFLFFVSCQCPVFVVCCFIRLHFTFYHRTPVKPLYIVLLFHRWLISNWTTLLQLWSFPITYIDIFRLLTDLLVIMSLSIHLIPLTRVINRVIRCVAEFFRYIIVIFLVLINFFR